MADAVLEGKPLISRYVTLSGRGIANPRNLEVRIGTQISELIEQVGGIGMRGPQAGAGRTHDGLRSTVGGSARHQGGQLPAGPDAARSRPTPARRWPASAAASAPRSAPQACCPSRCTGTHERRTWTRCRTTTSSTVSSAAAAPRSALPTSRWCSTIATRRPRAGPGSRTSAGPSTPVPGTRPGRPGWSAWSASARRSCASRRRP